MTELLAIAMSQRFISAAAERIQGKFQCPATVEIDIGPRHCRFSCSTDGETTAEALRQQAADLVEQFTGSIDDQTTQERDRLLRRSRWRMIVGAVISAALVVGALVPRHVATPLAVVILFLALVVLGYTVLNRFVWLQVRMRTLANSGSQEKSTLTATLTQAGEELATLFAQEQRSRELLPGLQAYLLGLTADDARRSMRFTAPPPPTLMLPGPADRDTPDDADPAETRDDGITRGFPEWSPWPPARARPLPGRMSPPE